MCARQTSASTLFILIVLSLFTFTDANPTITITPNVVNVGLTKTLEVTCTFRQDLEQIFDSLSSLVLMHSRTSKEDQFCPLVSVTNTSNLENGTILERPFETSGLINDTDVSYVKISWKYPGKDRAGVYKCEARGFNVTDGSEPLSITASLQADSPSIDMVISEMKNVYDSFNGQIGSLLSNVNSLQSNITKQINTEINRVDSSVSYLQSRVSSVESQVSSLSHLQSRVASLESQVSSLSYLRSRVANLEAQMTHVQTYQSILRTSKHAVLIYSSTWQGRRYWLTRSTSSFFSSTYAQATCVAYGGYLAEVNSYGELVFLRGFLGSYGSHCSSIFIGGTDEGHEGSWLNRVTGGYVAPLWWVRGQPDNHKRDEHCLSLSRVSGWLMNDLSCTLTSSNGIGFVCEIPE